MSKSVKSVKSVKPFKTSEVSSFFFEAVLSDDFATAKKLLSGGQVNINKRDSNGITPLGAASSKGSLKMVKLLIENGADINGKSTMGAQEGWFTPLHGAIFNNHFDVVKLLIRKAAYLNARDPWKRTPLHYAVTCWDNDNSYSSMQVLKEISEGLGVDLDAKDCNGNTALHAAASSNNIAAILILLFYGASIFCKNRKGETPFDLSGNPAIQDILKVLNKSSY